MSVIDLPAKAEKYRDEFIVQTKLEAWKQWTLGDGVKGQVRTIVLTEEQARMREQAADRFRLPSAVADAEQTDRAVKAFGKQDPKGWAALRCYHLGDKFGRSDNRSISLSAKIHHAEAKAVLQRAHSSFMYWRGEV